MTISLTLLDEGKPYGGTLRYFTSALWSGMHGLGLRIFS